MDANDERDAAWAREEVAKLIALCRELAAQQFEALARRLREGQ